MWNYKVKGVTGWVLQKQKLRWSVGCKMLIGK
jgi:hypothetical protein